MQLYIAVDGDDIGQKVGRARLADDVEAVRRLSSAIDAGNEAFKSYALLSGGSVVEAGGDEILIEVPADKISELPAIKHKYETAVGATCSIGVGMKVSEASKALLAAKLRGKNQIVFFNEDVDQLVAKAREQVQSEQEKIGDEYLGKAEHLTPIGIHKPVQIKFNPDDADRRRISDSYLESEADRSRREQQEGTTHWDYSHLLTPEQRARKFSLFVTHDPGLGNARAVLHGNATSKKDLAGAFGLTGANDEGDQHWPAVGEVVARYKPVGAAPLHMTVKGDRATTAEFGPIMQQAVSEHLGGRSLSKAAPAMNTGVGAGFGGVTPPSRPTVDAPTPTQGEHSEGEALQALIDDPDRPKAPEQTHAAADFERQLHEEATKGEDEDADRAAQSINNVDAVKAQIVRALQVLKVQQPVLEQVKQASPQLYQAIAGLTQSVISLAREISPMSKSEAKKSPAQAMAEAVLQAADPVQGHDCKRGDCYFQHEALHHLLGGPESGWEPHHVFEGANGPHWFLKHSATGKVLDTLAGDAPTPRPYHRGKRQGFITPEPSKQARGIIAVVLSGKPLAKAEVVVKGPQAPKPKKADPRQLTMDTGPATPAPIKEPELEGFTPDPRGLFVYRVQGPRGEGPYGVDPPLPERHYRMPHDRTPTEGGSQHGLIRHATKVKDTIVGSTVQPGPNQDFDVEEWREHPERDRLRFGFESPEHARAWFGTEALGDMKRKHRLELQRVPAKKIWRSKSGRQVVFLPQDEDMYKSGDAWDEESKRLRDYSRMTKAETMYCAACKDPLDADGHCKVKAHWPILDKEKLDKAALPMPKAPAHHKVVLPVGSTEGDKVKVQHMDGSRSWVQVGAGQIQAQDPARHPISSRNPSGR